MCGKCFARNIPDIVQHVCQWYNPYIIFVVLVTKKHLTGKSANASCAPIKWCLYRAQHLTFKGFRLYTWVLCANGVFLSKPCVPLKARKGLSECVSMPGALMHGVYLNNHTTTNIICLVWRGTTEPLARLRHRSISLVMYVEPKMLSLLFMSCIA